MLQFIKKFFDRKQKQKLGFLLAISVILALLEAAGVGAVIPFVAVIQSPDRIAASALWPTISRFSGIDSPAKAVPLLCAAILGLFLLKNGLSLLHLRQSQQFAQDFFCRLSNRLVAGYLSRPFTYFLGTNSATLVKNVMTETKLVAENLIEPIILLISEIMVVVSIMAVLTFYNPLLLVSLGGVVGLIMASVYRVTTARSKQLGAIREKTYGQMSKLVTEVFAGVKEIKVTGTEKYFLSTLEQLIFQHAAAVVRQNTIQQTPRITIETIMITVLLGSILVITSLNIPAGTLLSALIMYLAAAYRLMPSVNRIITALMRLKFIEAGFQQILQTLNDSVELKAEVFQPVPAMTFGQGIEVRAVSYRYPETDAPVLKNISLYINKGETVGLLGPSGVGKSTLLNLITGLLPVTSGSVLIDRHAVSHDEEFRRFRAAIAYVPQQVFLADDTFARNVALGLPDDQIDLSRLQWAIETAQLGNLVKELPLGLNTVVGERGARVSGGQAQRIGVARALYRDAPFLILDEATSALDVATETNLMDALKTLGRTVLIIAHRHTALQHCNRIYRIEDGTVGKYFLPGALSEQGRQADE